MASRGDRLATFRRQLSEASVRESELDDHGAPGHGPCEMILGVAPIDLRPLHAALSGLVDLDDIPLAATDPFEEPSCRAAIAAAVSTFRQWVGDRCDQETSLRRGLAYLINLDDERMLAMTSRLHLPMRAHPGTRRRFLRMLWDATFASPEVSGFDVAEIELIGTPS